FQIAVNPQDFRAQAPTQGAGTVALNGTTTIQGAGTRFGRLNVGDVINVMTPTGFDETLYILNIVDDTHVTVNRAPDTVATGLAYTVGDPNLVPGTYYTRLTLDRPLPREYRRDPIREDPSLMTLNDGVVRIGSSATAPAEYFDVNDARLSGSTVPPWSEAFPAAYVEYIVLPQPQGPVPYLPRMLLSAGGPEAMLFVDKWFLLPQPQPLPAGDEVNAFKYTAPSNHQLILVGDTEPGGAANSGSNGFAAVARANERAAVLNRATVEYQVATSGSPLFRADPEMVLQRTLIHEMVHQWRTNFMIPAFGSNPDDHCNPLVAFDSTVGYPTTNGVPPAGLKFCLMTRADAGPTMPDPNNTRGSQISMIQYLYRNAWTTMHIAQVDNQPHSEYLQIRKQPDPWTP
ncbi:MAG: hypothetical protein ACTHQM_23745, partial [Thermoanaerobaculia bacterium]